jgi:peptidoglycan-associated lipoprotein
MVSSSWRAFFLLGVVTLTACAKRNEVNSVPPSAEASGIEPGASPASGGTPALTDPRADDEERRRAERVTATIMERIHFDYDRSDLSEEAQRILQAKISVLREVPDLRIRIEGHADERGSDQYNDALGQQRAAAVKRYIAGFNIDASRLEIVSFGEQRPICQSGSDSCWAQNRRAEFQIIAGADPIR